MVGVSTSRVASLGEYLREQRSAAQLSLRQLAEQAGVSNPYLSQVERGLRKPSAEVLNKIASALQISSEHLYVRAGLLDEDSAALPKVVVAIQVDPSLTARQRQTLLDVYQAFVAQNGATSDGTADGSYPGATARTTADEPSDVGAAADVRPTDVPAGHESEKE
jgi:transcriptional regulator with XRE-family HTH domain